MISLRTVLLALSASLCAAPVIADPVTFSGKLGNLDIVVELTADPAEHAGDIAGRYFYRSRGVDIPLRVRGRDGHVLELAEEEPCNAEKCGEGEPPPVGAVWRLRSGPDGRLSGTWKGARELDLALVREGRRSEAAAPKTPLDLFGHSEGIWINEHAITMASAPYDRLRVDVAMTMSDPLGWEDAKFNFATDPRIGYASPRIAAIAGGSPERANAALEQRHWRYSLSAFTCASLQYAGFTRYGVDWATETGSFGGWDTDAWSEVVALTPKLMTWTESGSRYCGGAHPYNYYNAYTMDVAAGEILSLGDMFRGAGADGPGEALAAFVRDNRTRPQPGGFDAEHEEECGIDDLIAEYLSARLGRDGDDLRIVFALERLPHAINACADDLLEIPAAQARGLVTPRFAALLGL